MASRKLLAEIEKVLKKVAEGVETFEAIFEKIQSTTNLAQKEKYEQDLKKEIKKLQRFRDQIKTWQASNEVKDKRPLNENRRLIETQMERFKACEKELKTKAFSKEGLNAATKVDPREQEKDELCSWVTETVEALNLQVEKFEAEQESLQLGLRKSKKDSGKQEKLLSIAHQIERHKFHMTKLEIILRMLENGNLSFEEVRGIQDDVNFYVESNQDPDFAEDEGIYDELSLEDAEVYGFANEDDDASEISQNEAPVSPIKKEESSAISDSKKDDVTSRRKSVREKDQEESPGKTKANVTKRENSTVKVDESRISSSKSTSIPKIAPLPPKPGSSIPAKPAPLEAPAPLAQKWASAAAASSASSSDISNRPSPASVLSGTPKEDKSSLIKKDAFAVVTGHVEPQSSSISGREKELMDEIAEAIRDPMPSLTGLKASLFQDIISNFGNTAFKSNTIKEKNYFQLMLDSSLQYHPDAVDSEKPSSYMPKVPYPTPSYYPQTPYPLFDKNPLIFEKFDTDTLFFIFYYQQGTYQQYLAAQQLKRHSWRFHKKYLTWFQRHDEPKSITDDYEQGTYIYFDYESAWSRRKKADFRFEYQYLLEDD